MIDSKCCLDIVKNEKFLRVWKLVERHRDALGGEEMAGVDGAIEIKCDKPVDGLLDAILNQFSDLFYEHFLNELGRTV